jgi:Ser/Thr protein kinase RdoA (MazF antagonist)
LARLPGHPEVNRVDTDALLARTAAVLARIHSTRADPRLEVTIGPQPREIWVLPSPPPPRNSMLRRSHETPEQLCATETESVLIHRDFFSSNLLWLRGKLTGVVDWRSVGRGPREWDLANWHTDLVILSGWRTADRLLAFYRSEAGRTPQGLAEWDLYCGLIGIENFRGWLVPYRE